MRWVRFSVAAAALLTLAPWMASAALQQLKISDNGRFFVKADGAPFFYLGDTAWGLFAHTTREDVDLYLQDRASKGFTVVQAVVVLWDGLRRRNPYGQLPLIDGDPTKPNEAYFEHVDYAIDQAEALGLYVAVLPSWDKGFIRNTNSPLVDPEKMRTFCEFLGRRYRDKPIIWVLGGDWPGRDTKELSAAMAEGLHAGDEGQHLITYHPTGRQSSSFWFQDAPWLDFNFIQSGHFIHNNNYELISADYAKTPIKPTMDAEPGYENITDRLIRNDPNAVRISAWDVRRYGYLGVFAGAAGHTYGCGEVYEFWSPGRGPLPGWAAGLPWKESLQLPGAGQMKYLRALVESRPVLTRIPDQSLIIGDTFRTTERIQATRAEDGSYAFIYTASGKPVTVDLSKLSGKTVRAHWYDPRTGRNMPIGVFTAQGQRQFVAPSSGKDNDWVLVLDDASKGFSMPPVIAQEYARNPPNVRLPIRHQASSQHIKERGWLMPTSLVFPQFLRNFQAVCAARCPCLSNPFRPCPERRGPQVPAFLSLESRSQDIRS